MPTTTVRFASLAAAVFVSVAASACTKASTPLQPTTPSSTPDTPAPQAPTLPTTWDIDAQGVPQFITDNYIDLSLVRGISRFRSGEGHDYSDANESCRSMKHYFRVPLDSSARSIAIQSPVTGAIVDFHAEWAGVQIAIQPDSHPAFRVILFHVNPQAGIELGARLNSGDAIGTHIGEETMSDVAVAVSDVSGYRLVSYFDALSDAAFGQFLARGVESRDSLIISRGERDANPLSCNGETFESAGNVGGWVGLN